MKFYRFCLLLFMAMLLVLMVGLPGLQDTRQMVTAWNHYHDSPNDTTRKEIDDARIADRKQMVIIEAVLGAFLTLSAILFFRLGKKNSNQIISGKH